MLHLRFLGTFHVTFADGRTPAIDTAKSKALLAYLTTESDRPHLREQLATLLWPEADQKAAMQSLRQALYTLRRQLQPAPGNANGAPYFTVTRQDVAFNFDSEHWSDVDHFTMLIRAVQYHPHRQIETCPECAARLEEVIELYRGEFLSGLTLPDADHFEAWRLARHEWFRAQTMRALLTLTGFYERRREYGAAQRFLLRLLELEPWDEDAHRRLMSLYALDNQRAAAIQQFEATRHMLAQQLDAQPAPETLQLLQTIQQGAPLAAPAISDAPYKGLYPFSRADRADFFGREETVNYLVQQLNNTPTAFLIGPSGSGKSSIIRAGVIPTLLSIGSLARLTQRQGGRTLGWSIVELRPGVDPLHALAEAIARLPKAGKDIVHIMQNLRVEGATLGALDVWPSHTRPLIFVDQFEELYTLCASAAARRMFIELLFNSTLSPAPGVAPITLIIAMRADFVNQALTHRPLADALQHGGVVLGPMARRELRRAIEEPARNRGVTCEPGLTERLLDDVGDEPGNLPLLQFALAELWARRAGYQITHDAYDEIGRVSGALASYADQVYAQLTSEERAIARRLLIQLVQPGDETGDTRRPALRAELSDAAWALAQKLADLRLVVTGYGDGGESVELVHEALIRSWAQLRAWMEEDRDFRRWQQRLRAYLQQWIASDREADALLRGAVLTEAEGWITLRRDDLSQSEQALIDASVRARDEKQAEMEAARQFEFTRTQALVTAESQRAEAEHRRAEIERTASRRLRLLSIGLAGVLAVAIVAAILAYWQQRQANLFAKQALARQLAAQSINLAKDETDLALLLGTEAAARTTDSADLTNFLVSFPLSGFLDRFLRGGSGDLTHIAVTADGEHLLTIAEEGSLTSVAQWDVTTGRLARELLPPGERSVVALSSDGARFATADKDEIQLWDGASGAAETSWRVGAGQTINALQFSADSRLLLTKTAEGVITLWNIATRRPEAQITIPAGDENVWLSSDNQTVAVSQDVKDERGMDLWRMATGEKIGVRLGGHESAVNSVAFSADGSKIATASFDGAVRLWDAADGTLLHPSFTEHEGRVLSVAFSPDGRILATGGADHKILLYDVATGEQISEPLVGHDNWVRDLRFDAAGDVLYSAATGGSLIRWDMTRRKLFDGHTDRVRSLALSPDGRTLATSGFDARILLWDAATGKQLAELPTPHERSIIQVTYSPDGRYLAAADAGGMVSLWDVEKRQLLRPPLTEHESVLIGLAFSPDSRNLAVGDFLGNLSIWDVASGELMSVTPDAHDGWALALAFSPDGQTLASGGTDGHIQLWDTSALAAASGGPLRTRRAEIAAHDYWVTSLLYTADGKTLISGSADNTVRFWDTSTGAEIGSPLTGTTAQIWGVQFYPPHGERTLIVLGNNGSVRLWDIASRTPRAPALRTGLETEDFAVSPDGAYVFLGSFDERAERWWLDSMPWNERSCAIAARALRSDEWAHYLRSAAYDPQCIAP
jgi:WD40 repeat protein/DNA-binding SARP family transcriptional activator